MCSEFDSECELQVCDICYDLVDSLDMIAIDSQIICCSCYFEYLDDEERNLII